MTVIINSGAGPLQIAIESLSIRLNVSIAVHVSGVFPRNPADKSASHERRLDDQEIEFSGH
jgi:hypothetical protein